MKAAMLRGILVSVLAGLASARLPYVVFTTLSTMYSPMKPAWGLVVPSSASVSGAAATYMAKVVTGRLATATAAPDHTR